MNKRRRRIGRARRHKKRVIREIRQWTRVHDADRETPRGGRLRLPVMRLRVMVAGWFASPPPSWVAMQRLFEPFVRRVSPSGSAGDR